MKHSLHRLVASWLLLCLFSGLGGPLAAQAQAPAWQTALSLTDNTSQTYNYSYVAQNVDDGNGNVYLTGGFAGTLQLGTTTLVSLSDVDIFVAKYNVAAKQYVWAVRGGGAGDKYPQAIAFSNSAVYVTGLFYGTAAGFGSISLVGDSNSNAVYDLFATKITDAGTSASFTWAVRAGGSGRDIGNGIAVSGSSVYLTGDFDSPQMTFGNTTLPLVGGEDSFLVKLTDAGKTASVTWVQQWGGPGVDDAFGVTVAGNALYVGGPFTLACPFSSTTTLTSAGGKDSYVAKFIDAGSSAALTWVRQVGGAGDEVVSKVLASGSTVYAAGNFSTPTLTVGSTTLTSAGSTDALIVKLTDAGSSNSVVWALRGGGAQAENIYALTLSGGSLYGAGVFNDATSAGTPGSATFGTTTLQSAGGTDALLVKVSDNGSTGSFAWAKQAGGSAFDYAQAVSVVGTTVVVGGGYESASISFGSLTLPNSSAGNGYGYLATTSTTVLSTQAAQALAAEALYPNPAHGRVTVQLPASAAGLATLRLRDALGRVVREAVAPAGRPYDLDLAGLSPGVYVVQVQAGEVLATRPLVVE